jgi:hypothetical protein
MHRAHLVRPALAVAVAVAALGCNTQLPSQSFDAARCALTLTTPVTATGTDGVTRDLEFDGCRVDWDRDTTRLSVALFAGTIPGSALQPTPGTLTLLIDGAAPANSTLEVHTAPPGSPGAVVLPGGSAMVYFIPRAGGDTLTGEGTMPIGDNYVGLAPGAARSPTVRFDANLGDVQLSDGSRLVGRFAIVATNP